MPELNEDLFDLNLDVPSGLVISLVEQSRLVLPDPGYLQLLDVSEQWEHQRRHPYYAMFRLQANFWRQFLGTKLGGGSRSHGFVPANDQERDAWACSHLILHYLGLNGYLPSPRLRWDEIEPGIGDDRVGARNATRLELVVELMKDIDANQAKVISTLLKQAAEANESAEKPLLANHRLAALRRLNDWLGKATNGELLRINRFSQKEQVAKDVMTSHDLLRQETSAASERVHKDKVARDLCVWDLREGWSDGKYGPQSERTLKEIVEDEPSLSSISSARNSYCRAFKRITGVKYSPENWFWTVGVLKTQTTGFGPISASRPQRTKTSLEVPASKLGIDLNAWEPTKQECRSCVLQLKDTILELYGDGVPVDQIPSKVGLPADAVDRFFEKVESGELST